MSSEHAAAGRRPRAQQQSVGIALALLAATTSCQELTHAGDYSSYEGLCTECQNPALKRPPCPRPNDDEDTGKVYVYAARDMRFAGPSAAGPGGLETVIGYDMDCSSSGEPVRCQRRTPVSTSSPIWPDVPNGADNALSIKFLSPLLEKADAFGVDFAIDLNFENGARGYITVVEDWNGTPTDPIVHVSFHSSPGLAKDNGPPRWDGTDRWDIVQEDVDFPVPYLQIERSPGYIVDGVLVVEKASQTTSHFMMDMGPSQVQLALSQRRLFGHIDKNGITDLTFGSVIDLGALISSLPQFTAGLAACLPEAVPYLETEFPQLLQQAADMPSSPNAPPDELCDGLSLQFAMDAEPAQLGGYRIADGDNFCDE